MIVRCLIVTITRNRKGQPIRSAKRVDADPITIGRGAAATVHLPDPRVHLKHAVIRSSGPGEFDVEAPDAAIDKGGGLGRRARLRPGERVLIEPYQITLEPPTAPDHDLVLAVELVQPSPENRSDLRERSRTSLSATCLSKRGFAWAAFGTVGCLFLALPLAYATSPRFREAALDRFPQPLKRVAWDVAWDPGPLSRGHQPLRHRCNACHQVSFERVQDRACVECHTATGAHVRAASIRAGVTLVVPCADCHRDHAGERAIVRADARLCVDCHAEMKTRHPKSTLPAITDFASDHPPLRLSMRNAPTGEIERLTADQLAAGEASGLKFPHATHLAREGIRSPAGRRVLGCSHCHEPDAADVRFEPVKMAESCAQCHKLEFEPAVSARQVPHGDPADILTTLREFYSRIALRERPIDVTLVNELLRRPLVEAGRAERQSALAWAEHKARAVAADLIESRVCVQCHEVSRVSRRPGSNAPDGGPAWRIPPVRITSRWLAGSVFDHKSHRQSKCETCHDVRSSLRSADISIPTLETCQSCHAGAAAVKGKIRSPCETCHSFHQQPRTAPVAAARVPGPAGGSSGFAVFTLNACAGF